MKDELSQILKNTIERIERVPVSTISKLLETLYYERVRILELLNYGVKWSILIVSRNKKVLFYNEFTLKWGILSKEGNEVYLNDAFGEVLDGLISKLLKENVECTSIDIPLNLRDDVIGGVLKERFFRIECSTLDFQEFFVMVFDKTYEFVDNIDKFQDEVVKSLSNIVSGVAHEIKNPLSSIYLHTKIIKKLIEKRDLKVDYIINEIDIILSEIERLNEIVNNVMFSLRPYKYKEKYENVNKIVEGIVELLLPEIRSKKISIEMSLDEGIPMILCDKDLIKQVFINLIKNSIESIDNPNGLISIKTYFVSRIEGDFVVVEVKDNGKGIPDEVKHRIFEPFFTTKDNGTGLGLSIVYRIIKLHKGFIDFSSREGETIFKVFLPVSSSTRELGYYKNQ
ncbi:MAG: ATP-binding protein [Brevinematales bacterium]|nr:ATP-binding protein [Brevinematales bacterium]